MARSTCSCGNQILWKADEPQSDEWLLAALPDLPDDRNEGPLGPQAAFCRSCGRLWVAWHDDDVLAEYVPADPGVRPVRKPQPRGQETHNRTG